MRVTSADTVENVERIKPKAIDQSVRSHHARPLQSFLGWNALRFGAATMVRPGCLSANWVATVSSVESSTPATHRHGLGALR